MSPDSSTWPTELAAQLAGRGPMPFRDYMAEALYAEEHGYYTRRDLRRRGDRPTSRPEFVAKLAQPVARALAGFAEDHEPRVVEHGPGAGLLMRYVLSSIPDDLRRRLDVTFVEPRLARRTRLLVLLQEFGVEGRVVSSVRDVDAGPSFVIARELLGSFPVHWLERVDEGWREVHVAVPEDAWVPEERLEKAPPQLVQHADEHGQYVPGGHRYEVNLHLRRWLSQIRHVADPGLVCAIDRPVADPPGEQGSIRALRDGEPVGVYEAPGITDISSGVDLNALVELAQQAGFEDVTESNPAGKARVNPLEPRVLSRT